MLIKGDKTIKFTAEGIAFVLDTLANCPWKVANPLINDIMGQLKAQEGDSCGPILSRSGETATSGRNTRTGDSRISPVEAFPTDNRTQDVGGYSCDDPAATGSRVKGAR